MAREKKQPAEDAEPGAPEWMVTFSDCMTLLLTFFVLLLTFSSFDVRVFRKLRVIYCDAFPTIHSRRRADQESFMDFDKIRHIDEIDKGSEKPTLEQGRQGGLRESISSGYQKHKVFLTSADTIFWGKGSVMSPDGQNLLAIMAEYLRKVPGRVVISESYPDKSEPSQRLGLSRAWAIVRYLTETQGLSKDRFNISASSTVGTEGFDIVKLRQGISQIDRIVEIVLLERSIYN